jgi:hypothetical protein
MSNNSTKPLPAHLHAAFDWIDSAGEWDEALAGPAVYAAEAFANAVEHDQADVTEADLLEVIRWRDAAARVVIPRLSAGERQALLGHGGADPTSVSTDADGQMWLWSVEADREEMPVVLSLVAQGLLVADAPEDGYRTYRVTDNGRETIRALRAEVVS